MQSQNFDSKFASSEQVAAIFLLAFSMFMVGYTGTRVYLNQPSQVNTQAEFNVIPHQASLWSELKE
ncbi:MAG: hypothetical protein MGG11_17155 [Trichodesmium sp. MAG_R03]|nr:hypothetical protein [Trichodesmium sp. MAG_R03]